MRPAGAARSGDSLAAQHEARFAGADSSHELIGSRLASSPKDARHAGNKMCRADIPLRLGCLPA